MLNVGVVGLGNMGRLHMMNCLHIDDVKVVAAADSSKRALKKAQSVGVKNLYTDYHSLLNDCHGNMDAVIISLPNYLHFESVQLALEAGLNVFVEKPMANTGEECREIVKLVKKSGMKFMIGHCMRFYDVIEKMKDAADKGRIGKLEVVTTESIQNGPLAHGLIPRPVPEWWFDPKKVGGGALLDLGYHLIDLFRFFAGDSKVLFSYLDHKFNLPVEDGATVILASSNPLVRGIINVGWYQKSVFPKFNFRLILHGNAGYMSSDELIPSNPYLHAIKEGTKNLFRKIIGKNIRILSWTYWYESYYKELKHFFDCVKQDLDPSISASDGLKTIELIEEAYKVFDKNFT